MNNSNLIINNNTLARLPESCKTPFINLCEGIKDMKRAENILVHCNTLILHNTKNVEFVLKNFNTSHPHDALKLLSFNDNDVQLLVPYADRINDLLSALYRNYIVSRRSPK